MVNSVQGKAPPRRGWTRSCAKSIEL